MLPSFNVQKMAFALEKFGNLLKSAFNGSTWAVFIRNLSSYGYKYSDHLGSYKIISFVPTTYIHKM